MALHGMMESMGQSADTNMHSAWSRGWGGVRLCAPLLAPSLDASRLRHGAANDLEVALQLIGHRRRLLAHLYGRELRRLPSQRCHTPRSASDARATARNSRSSRTAMEPPAVATATATPEVPQRSAAPLAPVSFAPPGCVATAFASPAFAAPSERPPCARRLGAVLESAARSAR